MKKYLRKYLRKKKSITLIAMLLAVSFLVGCGKKDTAVVQVPMSSAVPKATTASETSVGKEAASHGKGKYTIEEIAQDVVINGQKVSIPFTLEDLGDDYGFDDRFPPHKSDNGYTDSIMYKDERRSVFTSLVQSDDGKLERTSKILSVLIGRTDYNHAESFVKGLGIGDSVDKMKEIFGEADKVVGEGTDLVEYCYGDKEKSYLSIMVRDEKVTSFLIRYIPEKR